MTNTDREKIKEALEELIEFYDHYAPHKFKDPNLDRYRAALLLASQAATKPAGGEWLPIESAGMGKQYFERGDWKFNKYDGKNTREYYVPVACGKCYECRKKKVREWRIRLAEEIRHNKSYFVTLTIDDESLDMLKNELEVKSVKGNENNIATLALRKFLERCRKKTGKSLKHWCVTELAKTIVTGKQIGRAHV